MRKSPEQTKYEHLKTVLRRELMGRASIAPAWYVAVKALNLAEQYHTGLRKDRKTPEFMHQVEIALYLLSMEKLMIDAPRTIAACLLHDLGEDYGHVISFEEIGAKTDKLVADDCRLLAKEYRGEKKTPAEYFNPLADSFVCSIVKGADRIHNLRTMAGVFSLEKQIAYCEETEEWFFTFLKKARRNFPEQEPIYENIKFILETQIRIYRSVTTQGVAA